MVVTIDPLELVGSQKRAAALSLDGSRQRVSQVENSALVRGLRSDGSKSVVRCYFWCRRRSQHGRH